MSADYVFVSERLGFRGWRDSDVGPMAAINADPEVMRYFPETPTREVALTQGRAFIEQMQREVETRGHCYWAVDELGGGGPIGFIGLHWVEHDIPHGPFVDIGWRLARSAWGKGYATEGARACLEDGFGRLDLPRIYAMAPRANTPSIRVMQKLEMSYVTDFVHPVLRELPALRECVLYALDRAR